MTFSKLSALVLIVAILVFGTIYFGQQSQGTLQSNPAEFTESDVPDSEIEPESAAKPVPLPIEEPKAREYFPENSPEGWYGLDPELNPESCSVDNSPPFALRYCNLPDLKVAYSKRWVEESGQNGLQVRVISGNVFIFSPGTQEKTEKVILSSGSLGPDCTEYSILGTTVRRCNRYLYLSKHPDTSLPSSPDDPRLEEDFEKLTYYLDTFEKGSAIYVLYYEPSAQKAAKEIIGLVLEN
ncbi:MAG: hypothetical protein JW727_00270 [Candidatus Aenigmarchaeota archaeon]|nr:hypothetical protein [Candidatus Aenigmarchaeota archaeon]